MLSSIFEDYEKVNFYTKYTGIFFVSIAFISLLLQPEPSHVGYFVSMAVVVVAMAVLTYNDIRHKKYDRLKKRALGGLLVILITAVYFIFFFDISL